MLHFQQAVQSLCLAAASLAYTLCGASRGCRQSNVKSYGIKYGYKSLYYGGFSRAGTSGKYHNTVFKRRRYCLLLQGGVFKAAFRFGFGDKSGNVSSADLGAGFVYLPQLVRAVGFRTSVSGEGGEIHPAALKKGHLSAFFKGVERLCKALLRNAQHGGGNRQQSG